MWTIDHDHDRLWLLLPTGTAEAFAASSFYKLFLRRYAETFEGDQLRFRSALTYLDYKKVIEICQKEADKRGTPLQISQRLQDFINSREMHIAVRSRLGVELKAHDDKLLSQFEEYSRIVNAGMARQLREQQMWDSFFMCTMKKSANFSVPGSGKTASVLGMYAYLKATQGIRRILVVCPKNAFGSWMDEFTVCFRGIESLNVMNIHDSRYKDTAQRKSALKLDCGSRNLILVNYEAVGSIIEDLLPLLDQHTLLAFDEVHKIKRIHGAYAEQSLRLAREASYTVAMTGTPIPNTYSDIYNLLHVLYNDEYDEFFNFSPPMLKKPGADEIQQINDKLQPFFCRTTKEQLGVPAANADTLCQLRASEDENALQNILQIKYRKNKLPLLIRLLQMESDPQMLLKALDMKDFAYLLDDSVDADEIDYADYSTDVKQLIAGCQPTTKFTHCVHQAKELAEQGKPVIIWCMFVDSIQKLSSALEKEGITTRCVYGEVPLDERQQILNDFRSGKVKVLLTNPHTLAESVSLHSVCHDAIYYEYSYNLVHLLQSKDRIHRLGLPDGQYTQYYYDQVVYQTEDGDWSLGEAIYNRLKEKEEIMLEAIANRRLEVMPTSKEDLDLIFGRNISD